MTLKFFCLHVITPLLLTLFLGSGIAAQVRVDVADGRVRGDLQRVESLLADQQWDEAIETIRRIADRDGDRLLRIDACRYISLCQYAQALLAQLPAEALVRYRAIVDPGAEQDYLAGRFERVVREAYASSYGDDALLALGEAALNVGDADLAYHLWNQILPTPVSPKKEGHQKSASPGFPDSTLDPAAVRARLILASILAGHDVRAQTELARFRQLHPHTRGRFAGEDNADYAELLQTLLDESEPTSQDTASPKSSTEINAAWPTFAGNPARNRIVKHAVDVSRIAWHNSLEVCSLSVSLHDHELQPYRHDFRVAYHPVLSQNRLFLIGENAILGFEADSGKPLWGSDGTIYRATEVNRSDAESEKTSDSVRPRNDEIPRLSEGTIGIPQFTATICDDRLYARIGTPQTSGAGSSDLERIPIEPLAHDVLVCLDVKAEGRLVWQIEPDEKGWAFDGTPIADGKNIYVAMRRGGIRPEAHVACFDAARGTRRWRRFICSAPPRSIGKDDPNERAEYIHNLLTLKFDTLYFNTNLGAIAALETETGSIRWLTCYAKNSEATKNDQADAGKRAVSLPDSARSLCPCVHDRGTLYVASADSAAIFALDAFSGELLWSTGHKTADVVHLLGTLGDRLVASGNHLYWIATSGKNRGQIVRCFPEGDPIAAYGRGILAGGRVYWPTREHLFLFDKERLVKTIPLTPLGLSGGNLTIAGSRLIITTDREMTALE